MPARRDVENKRKENKKEELFFANLETLSLRVGVGFLTFGTVAVGANYVGAQVEVQPDVPAATATISEARNFALEWAKFSRFDADETIEAVAESICARQIEGMKISLALKSVEVVALPTSEAGVPERKIVRVLFSDGSVKYFDDRFLAGQAEPLTTPSVAVVDATPEYAVDLDAFHDEGEKRTRAILVERAVARYGGDGSDFSGHARFGPKKTSVVPVPRATNEANFIKIVRPNAAAHVKSRGFDAETSAMYIAAHVNFQRAGILKTVGIYPKNALKEIASVKIVPFVVAETLEAEKLVRPTVGCVVRVAYLDGAVKYCDDGA